MDTGIKKATELQESSMMQNLNAKEDETGNIGTNVAGRRVRVTIIAFEKK